MFFPLSRYPYGTADALAKVDGNLQPPTHYLEICQTCDTLSGFTFFHMYLGMDRGVPWGGVLIWVALDRYLETFLIYME